MAKDTNSKNNPAISLLRDANKHYLERDYIVAERLYRKITELVPDDYYAYFQIGNTLMRQERFEAAIEAYESVLQKEPTLIEAYNNLATAHMLLAEQQLVRIGEQLASKSDEQSKLQGELVSEKISLLRKISSLPIHENRGPIAQ